MILSTFRSAVFVLGFLVCSQAYAGMMSGQAFFNTQNGVTTSINFDGQTLQTLSAQQVNLELIGILDSFSSLSNDTGTISIDGVTANGAPFDVGALLGFSPGNTLSQETIGGDFEIEDSNGTLLLSGDFGGGTIDLAATSGFRSNDITFTDGLFLPAIDPNGSLSLSFSNVSPTSGSNIQGFNANFTGQVDVLDSKLPEPGSCLVMAPILLAVLTRRRSL